MKWIANCRMLYSHTSLTEFGIVPVAFESSLCLDLIPLVNGEHLRLQHILKNQTSMLPSISTLASHDQALLSSEADGQAALVSKQVPVVECSIILVGGEEVGNQG